MLTPGWLPGERTEASGAAAPGVATPSTPGVGVDKAGPATDAPGGGDGVARGVAAGFDGGTAVRIGPGVGVGVGLGVIAGHVPAGDGGGGSAAVWES
jgi:hypothetical protein